MTASQIVGSVIAWTVALLACWLFVRVGSSGHMPKIEQRVSKADLDFCAKLASRRHAALHTNHGKSS